MLLALDERALGARIPAYLRETIRQPIVVVVGTLERSRFVQEALHIARVQYPQNGGEGFRRLACEEGVQVCCEALAVPLLLRVGRVSADVVEHVCGHVLLGAMGDNDGI